jgi:hypothetical protein
MGSVALPLASSRAALTYPELSAPPAAKDV